MHRTGRPALAALLILGPILFIVPSVAQTPAATLWEMADPAGDQYLNASYTQTPPQVPGTPRTDHGDIRGVSISKETALGLNVSIKLQRLVYQPLKTPGAYSSYNCQQASSGTGNNRFFEAPTSSMSIYTLNFERPETTMRYTAVVRLEGDETPSGYVIQRGYAYLCVMQGANQGWGPSIVQLVDLTIDPTTQSLHVWISKAALVGRAAQPNLFSFGRLDVDTIPPVRLGERLGRFVLVSGVSPPIVGVMVSGYQPLQDRVPNAGVGPEFEFRTEAANQQIRLDLPGTGGQWPVASGRNQSINVGIVNTLGAKRILLLDYALEGAGANDYGVYGPTSITVPGGDSRNFTIALNAPATAKAEDDVRLVARATSAGFPNEIGHDEARLAPTPVLDDAHPDLFIHSRQTNSLPLPDAVPKIEAHCAAPFTNAGCYSGYLSPLADDPAAHKPDRLFFSCAPGGGGNHNCYQRDMVQAFPSPIPLAIAKRPVEITLNLRSATTLDGAQLTATLSHGDSSPQFGGQGGRAEQIASGSTTASIGSTAKAIPITAAVTLPAGTRIPAGSYLRLLVTIQLPAATIGGEAHGVELLGGAESKIRLPLDPIPQDEQGLVSASPFQLAVTGGREEFLNPGEGRLYNVTLLNQDVVARHALLNATLPAGWRVEIQPGIEFDLETGDAIRLGVIVHAPKDAAEGAKATIVLNATSEGTSPASLRLVAISTSGVDLPDDSNAYTADPDAQKALFAPPKKESPGVGALALVGIVVLAAALRRRRA